MDEEKEEGKKETRKRVNVGARLGMIAPVISLGATAAISIYTYWQHYPLVWWLIIFFASLVFFLLLGSVIQTMVELFVEHVVDKEAEEKRLLEIRAINDEGVEDEGSVTGGAAAEEA